MAENNEGAGASPEAGANGEAAVDIETVSVPKKDYDKLNETVGSLKRELKDLRKAAEQPKNEPAAVSNDTSSLVEKAFFNSAGIKDPDVQKLAKEMAKRTGEGLDVIVEDEVFKARAEKILNTKQNDAAAAGEQNRGTQGASGKDTPEYWLAKLGVNEQVPSDLPRALRQKIVAMRRDAAKNGKQFYND